jgi:hypothetical protein
MSFERQSRQKNRVMVEFIKAEIRTGIMLANLAAAIMFCDAGHRSTFIADARQAFFTARKLAVANLEIGTIVTEDALWIAKNLYNLELAINRLGNQEG